VKTAQQFTQPQARCWHLIRRFLQISLLCNHSVRKCCLVRDQEVGGSNPLAPTKYFIRNLPALVGHRDGSHATATVADWKGGPGGRIKRIDRPREGKVWVGFFHRYVADPSSRAFAETKRCAGPQGRSTMPSATWGNRPIPPRAKSR